MKRLFLALSLLAFAAPSQAAVVTFVGTTTNDTTATGGFASGTSLSLVFEYTPVAMGGGAVAAVTAANLAVGSETWNVLVGGASDTTQIVDDAPGDDLSTTLQFAQSTPGSLGQTLSSLVLLIDSDVDVGVTPDATEANISLLTSFGTPGSGSLTLFTAGGGAPSVVTFAGVATPEPTSMALLGGLALAGCGRILRRRNKVVEAV